MNFHKKIKELNELINNPRDSYEVITGYETVLEAMVYQIYDLFGRNALLSMLYTIGAGPAKEIAEEILKEKGVDKIEDPFEIMKLLLEKNKDFYSVQIQDIKLEPFDDKTDKLIMEIQNECFYRKGLKRKNNLKRYMMILTIAITIAIILAHIFLLIRVGSIIIYFHLTV